jgi:hypothetical protein
MIMAVLARPGPKTAEDNIPGQGDEKRLRWSKVYHVAEIPRLSFFFEPEHDSHEVIEHMIRAAKLTSGICSVPPGVSQNVFATGSQLVRTYNI